MIDGMASLRTLVTALVCLMGSCLAEDVLYSDRLMKRHMDSAGHYNISFYHINDVHAHLDQFAASGTDCKDAQKGCYGGYARVKTVLDQSRPQHPDSLLLNVGDEFQGTLFYTYYGGEKIAETLNKMGFDAMTIGNHEFDGGDEKLGDFLQNLTFPIVSANIVSDNAKLNSTIKPYHIFPQYGLAVIGVTTEVTKTTSRAGKGTNFTDAVQAVQRTVNLIRQTTNITRIAAITHIGYEEDQKLAEQTTGLYLIMGGHSHSLLGSMKGAEGPYPTVRKNKDGDDVYIVTAYRWGEYLGYIDVTYDAQGKVVGYHGAPIHLTNTTAQDKQLQADINAWRAPFDKFAAQVIGKSSVVLDQTRCQSGECLLGDLITDAMSYYRKNASANVDFALINAGGIRATIPAGDVTRGDVLIAFPFGNSVVELTLTGQAVWDMFEGLVSKVSKLNGKAVTSFFQISSGARVVYKPGNAVGSRLVAVTIAGSPLDLKKQYTVVTIDFVATGGDNILEVKAEATTLDTLDEVLTRYFQTKSPITAALDGRIATVAGTASGGNGSTNSSTSVTPVHAGNAGRVTSDVGYPMALLVTMMVGMAMI